MLGLLSEAVRVGDLSLEDYQVEAVIRTARSWLTHDLWVERELLRIADVLTGAGIPFRVLKGVALANSVYADPALRVFGDIDILVAADRFVDAATLLAESRGAIRELPELRPGFDRRFGREILLRSGATEIDVHRTLVDGPYGLTIPLADLLEDPIEFPLGDRVLPGLGHTDRFLHACYSVALSLVALPGTRDRVEYLRAVVRPSREYLDARGFRPGDRLRKAIGLRVPQRR